MQFVTEKEVEEIKERKQKEWEKVRRPDQPLERPEEEYDSRTLYEKLKSQRDQKQEAFEEQLKFKNMIYKGLDDDEAVFLQLVADKRAKLDAETRDEENQELLAYRDAVDKLREEAESVKPQSSSSSIATSTSSTSSSSSNTRDNPLSSSKPHKSQLSLIAGSIKTKRKRSATEELISPEKKHKYSRPSPPKPDQGPTTLPPSSSSALSGIAAYSSDSDESPDHTDESPDHRGESPDHRDESPDHRDESPDQASQTDTVAIDEETKGS
jgi:hypothetical protein